MTGRGERNLYRPIYYRTAGGSFVRSRKIEYGVYKQLTKPNNGYIIWVSIDTFEGMSWLKKQKLELKVS